MEESPQKEGKNPALSGFLKKAREKEKAAREKEKAAREKAPAVAAAAGEPPAEEDEVAAEERRVAEQQRQATVMNRNASKKYLFGVWKTILSNQRGDYDKAVLAIETALGGRSKMLIPIELTPTDVKLPPAHTATIEQSERFKIIKAFDNAGNEVVHLTIPRKMPDNKELHYTWGLEGLRKESVKYDADGGRLLKQKRTRRVVRRLVGTRSSRVHGTRRVRHSLSVLQRNTR